MDWRKLLRAFVVVTGLLFAVLAVEYFVYPLLVKPDSGAFDIGENGLWLGSKWYHGKVTDDEIIALAALLQKERIRYAYFHSRDIDANGKLRFHSEPAAKKLVHMLHERAPGVKVIAWIGAVNSVGGGDVDLAKPAVVHEMAREAGNIVRTCGYDGVQWDFEPCYSGDRNYLQLLRETRQELPQGALLSQAIPWFWSDEYITENSKLCDQLALMEYDRAIYGILPRVFVMTVRNDTIRIANDIAAGGTSCKLIMGVPTYDEALGHHVHAENIRMALIGVKDALASPDCLRNVVAGVAPYAEWTTTGAEWHDYEQIWLGKKQ